MDGVVRIPESEAGPEFGLAVSICFSCGLKATRGVQVWFEDLDRGTLAGLKNRRSYEIPVCEACGRLGLGHWPKILAWGALALIGVFLPIFLAPALGLMSADAAWESPLVLGCGVVLSLIPGYFATEHWSQKDQGGGFVQFVGAGAGFVDLRLADDAVAAQVRELLAS